MSKTLIGKNGYLFLINDSCDEINTHQNNVCKLSADFYKKYTFNNFLLVVFPNKSLTCKQYLPDGYDLQYRPTFNKYADYLKNNIIDGYNVIINKTDTFYKTDTHLNLKGSYAIYLNFIEKINNLFKLNIISKIVNIQQMETTLSSLNCGIGDLTWQQNLGNQILTNTQDNYYFTTDFEQIYTKHSVNGNIRLLKNMKDITTEKINTIIDWNIISECTLFVKNDLKKHRVLIFYDSFLLSTLALYLEMFNEVYMIKSVYNTEAINEINPDFVFEFRVERFL
jgi:hypothetical protein